jgi:hypothetical protein
LNTAVNALARARAIASQTVEGLGIQLGNLIYASNQSLEQSRVLFGQPPMLKVDDRAGTPAPLAIIPRKVKRSATVYAVFAIQ